MVCQFIGLWLSLYFIRNNLASDEYEEEDLCENDDLKEEGDVEDIEENDENQENGSEEEEEVDNEGYDGSEAEEDDDVENVEPEATTDTFTEMKNMYRPKTTLQSGTNSEEVDVTETSKENVDVNESEEEEEDVEGSEHSEDIEDVEEEEDLEDEEEDEASDVDDEDLMKRLESKYGKLPERTSSDDEEIEDKWTSNFSWLIFV